MRSNLDDNVPSFPRFCDYGGGQTGQGLLVFGDVSSWVVRTLVGEKNERQGAKGLALQALRACEDGIYQLR